MFDSDGKCLDQIGGGGHPYSVPVPVTEGAEAHGGGHKRHSPGEGGLTTEQEGEHTAHTHGEKLKRTIRSDAEWKQ